MDTHEASWKEGGVFERCRPERKVKHFNSELKRERERGIIQKHGGWLLFHRLALPRSLCVAYRFGKHMNKNEGKGERESVLSLCLVEDGFSFLLRVSWLVIHELIREVKLLYQWFRPTVCCQEWDERDAPHIIILIPYELHKNTGWWCHILNPFRTSICQIQNGVLHADWYIQTHNSWSELLIKNTGYLSFCIWSSSLAQKSNQPLKSL